MSAMQFSVKASVIVLFMLGATPAMVRADLAPGYVMESTSLSGGFSQFTAYNGELHSWSESSGYRIYNVASGTTTTIGKPPKGTLSNGYGDPFGVLDPVNNVFYAGTYKDYQTCYVYQYDRAVGTWNTQATGTQAGVKMINAYGGQIHDGQLYVSGLAEPWNGDFGQDTFIFAYDHNAVPGGAAPRHDTLCQTVGNSAHVAVAANGDVYYGTYQNPTVDCKLYRWTAAQIAGVTDDLYAPGAVDHFLTLDDAQAILTLPGGGNGLAVDAGGNVFFAVNNYDTINTGGLPIHTLGMVDPTAPNGYREILTIEDYMSHLGAISVDGDFLHGGTLYLAGDGPNIVGIRAVPEPGTIILLVTGALSLVGLQRRKKRSILARTEREKCAMRMRQIAVTAMLMLAVGLASSQVAQAAVWDQQSKLTANDGAASDGFGGAISISGNYIVAGAIGDDDQGSNSGSAYIYQRSGSTWTQLPKLTADDGKANDAFGRSVSISGDYAIIGADSAKVSNKWYAGAAYIYQRGESAWTQTAKLTASDCAMQDNFGAAVSISGDYAIVGSRNDDDKGSNSGSAYVYQRSGSAWTQAAKLTAGDGAASDYFGRSVSINGDYAIVTANGDDDKGADSGSAYIFHREGATWTQTAKLLASDGSAGNSLGNSASISGNYAIVGAWYDNDKGGNSGSAYIFERDGSSWSQVAKLLAPDGAASDFFGTSVSISGDFALVGALQDDDKGLDSGSAYMFQRNGSDWTFLSKLNASDGMSNDLFGGAAAIDGFSAVMGATGVGGNGSAYVFAAVPEPSSFCLMAVAIGFGSAAWFYRRCRQRSGGIVMTR